MYKYSLKCCYRTMYQDILTLALSPAVVGYWSLKYLLGLSTPFDSCNPVENSLSKVFRLGLVKRMGDARLLGFQYLTKDTAQNLLLHKPVSYPGYGTAELEYGCWLAKPDDFDPTTDPCIVYCHGGGYMFRMCSGQLQYLKYLYESLIEKGPQFHRTAIFIVDYETTSEGKYYPSQFNHGINSYQRLMEMGCKNMVLIGDSAGGHMCLNILQWLSERTTSEQCVWPKKALLFSPWLDMCTESHNGFSEENIDCDYLHPKASYHMGSTCAQTDVDPWKNKYISLLANADQYDWKSFPTKVQLFAGGKETLLKSILQFSEITGYSLIIDKSGLHDGPLILEPEFYATRAEWLNTLGARTSLNFITC